MIKHKTGFILTASDILYHLFQHLEYQNYKSLPHQLSLNKLAK